MVSRASAEGPSPSIPLASLTSDDRLRPLIPLRFAREYPGRAMHLLMGAAQGERAGKAAGRTLGRQAASQPSSRSFAPIQLQQSRFLCHFVTEQGAWTLTTPFLNPHFCSDGLRYSTRPF